MAGEVGTSTAACGLSTGMASCAAGPASAATRPRAVRGWPQDDGVPELAGVQPGPALEAQLAQQPNVRGRPQSRSTVPAALAARPDGGPQAPLGSPGQPSPKVVRPLATSSCGRWIRALLWPVRDRPPERFLAVPRVPKPSRSQSKFLSNTNRLRAAVPSPSPSRPVSPCHSPGPHRLRRAWRSVRGGCPGGSPGPTRTMPPGWFTAS